MEKNQMMVTEFILLGFCFGPRIHLFLFGVFFLFYLLTLLGNGLILGLTSLYSRLHTPMYFFLSHLAIVDMAYACSTVPRCWSTSWVQPGLSPLLAASHRPFSSWVSPTLSVFSWWWCPMIGMWPSATPSGILSLWAGKYVSAWWWLPGHVLPSWP